MSVANGCRDHALKSAHHSDTAETLLFGTGSCQGFNLPAPRRFASIVREAVTMLPANPR